MSQHDTSVHESYGSRDFELQQLYGHDCGILGHRKSLRHYMEPWLAIQTIQIALFGQFDQAY